MPEKYKTQVLASDQQYCRCAVPPIPRVLVCYVDIGYPLYVLNFPVFHGINKHPKVVSARINFILKWLWSFVRTVPALRQPCEDPECCLNLAVFLTLCRGRYRPRIREGQSPITWKLVRPNYILVTRLEMNPDLYCFSVTWRFSYLASTPRRLLETEEVDPP